MYEVRVERLSKINGGKLKAFVDVIFNDALLVKGLRIIEGKHGPFVSMPSTQADDKKWYENVKVMDQGLKEQVSDVILYAYQNS